MFSLSVKSRHCDSEDAQQRVSLVLNSGRVTTSCPQHPLSHSFVSQHLLVHQNLPIDVRNVLDELRQRFLGPENLPIPGEENNYAGCNELLECPRAFEPSAFADLEVRVVDGTIVIRALVRAIVRVILPIEANALERRDFVFIPHFVHLVRLLSFHTIITSDS